MKYGPGPVWSLTRMSCGHCLAGSLTGVVASKSVTEASQGALRPIGNRPQSVMAEGRLTGRPTGRSGRKLGHSDPVVPHGRAIAQRIKGTPGITGCPKGWAVRPLKWHASWVQNVVRQFGLYLSWAQETCVAPALVREDRAGPTSGVTVVPPGALPCIRVGCG